MKPLLLAFAALLAAPAVAQAPVSGFAHAKDGDSVMVGDTEVRLVDIDEHNRVLGRCMAGATDVNRS